MRQNFILLILIFLTANLFSQNSFDSDQFDNLPAEKVFEYFTNFNEFTQLEETGIFLNDKVTFNDSLNAPFSYYIPSTYDDRKQTPLLVYLHGGVNRLDFVDEAEMQSDNIFADLAEENGWLLLIPFANKNCMWWDDAGFENIRNQIIFIKQNFNIDDNRVFLTGISDGGSGSYHLAMSKPDYFASFYPFIGMISVGNLVNGKHTYIANLANRYTAAVNCDKDGLYPAAKMRKLINLGQEAGADLFYKEYWGYGHDTEWLDDYKSEFINEIRNHPRDPFQSSLFWEMTEPDYNKCDWLEITKTDTLLEAADWHKSYNVKLSDDRMMFGFNHDENFSGEGTIITTVVKGSAAENAGLQEGDIIIKMDGKIATNIDSLITWRDAKKRGDVFSLTVLRQGSEELLVGQFPDITYYDAFNLRKKSAAAKARYYGNHFEIETSRVKEIAIYFHPEMINLDIPVTVKINGQLVFEGKINYDKEFMIKNFENNRDRKALWINKIDLKVPEER